MFEYFFLIIWHVGKPKEPKKGTLKILPQNLNPPPGGPLCSVAVLLQITLATKSTLTLLHQERVHSHSHNWLVALGGLRLEVVQVQ